LTPFANISNLATAKSVSIVFQNTTIKAKPKSSLRAKATLYGLSNIRRERDVVVNVMSTHTTVKTRFLVGPLVLKVEKEVSNLFFKLVGS
jgi:methylglutaconyl-CoA hydratase